MPTKSAVERMNRLYLVRHAQTRVEPARPPAEWDLDPTGQGLLAELASLSHWMGAKRIVSSSEPKAIKTAAAIVAAHPLLPAIETLDALRELHKGSFVADHDAAMAALFAFPDRALAEGWESGTSALTRISAAIDQMVACSVGEDLIVVSHGTILSLYIAHLQGQAHVDLADWAAIGMPDYCVVDMQAMRVIQPFGCWRTQP